jgi:hypothetical protein
MCFAVYLTTVRFSDHRTTGKMFSDDEFNTG